MFSQDFIKRILENTDKLSEFEIKKNAKSHAKTLLDHWLATSDEQVDKHIFQVLSVIESGSSKASGTKKGTATLALSDYYRVPPRLHRSQ